MLVEALTRLRLVNRSNLGVGRMYSALLMEGKEPPVIREVGESVVVSLARRELAAGFRIFVAEESRVGHALSIEHMLIIRYLWNHHEIDALSTARLCQRDEARAMDILMEMQRRGYLLRAGIAGRESYWSLAVEVFDRLHMGGHRARIRPSDWETTKAKILDLLMGRARQGEPGLSNRELRNITRFSRYKVIRLMNELASENDGVKLPGRGRFARYQYAANLNR